MDEKLQEIINYNLNLFIECLDKTRIPDIKSKLNTDLENMDNELNSIDKKDISPEIITTIGQIIQDEIKDITFENTEYTPLRRSTRLKERPIIDTRTKLIDLKKSSKKLEKLEKLEEIDTELEKEVIELLEKKLVLPERKVTNLYGENDPDKLPYYDDKLNSIYKSQKYNLTDKNILELYNIVYSGSIQKDRKSIDITKFIDTLIKFLPPTIDINPKELLGKNRNYFTSTSISTIVKFFHDDYIAVVDETTNTTDWFGPITNQTEKNGILDNIGIKNVTLGAYACVNRDLKAVKIGAGPPVNVIKLVTDVSRADHRKNYVNIDVYRQRCGTCWLCGKDVYIYKLIHKSSEKKKAWYYARLNCGEDEHSIPPVLGNIMGTLAPSNSATTRANAEALRLLSLGVAPSHITCNRVKNQSSFIKFPKKDGEIYTLNEKSIDNFISELGKTYFNPLSYTNDPYKYNLIIEPSKFNVGEVKKTITTYLKKILEIANSDKTYKSVYEIALANTAKVCCDTLDSIIVSLTKRGGGGGLNDKIDDDDLLKIVLCYLLIQSSIKNPEKEYISGGFNQIFIETKSKLNLLFSEENKYTSPSVTETSPFVKKTSRYNILDSMSNTMNDFLKKGITLNIGGKKNKYSKKIHRKSKKLHRKSKNLYKKYKNNKKTQKKRGKMNKK